MAAWCERLAQAHARLRDVVTSTPDVLGTQAPRVSAWSIGEHVQHVARVNGKTLHQLNKILDGDGEGLVVPTGSPNLVGKVILATSWIPRGKGKAPSTVLPAPELAVGDVLAEIASADDELATMSPRASEVLACTSRLPHPSLGAFTIAQWLKFMAIHCDHHEKLERDIARALG